MPRINTYPGDPNFADDDKLLGIDSATGGSATYTLGELTTYFNTGGATNTNYYLDGITQSGNVLTFSVNGATDQTFTFGSAAFAATTDFASASHTHTLGDVVGTNSITSTQLNVDGNGTSGQYLISDGDGSFSWSTVTNPADTNFYLDGITKSGETLTFSVNGASNQTYTFGEGAFLSITDITNQVKTAITAADLPSLGTLATLDSIGGGNINNEAVSTGKIQDGAITEPKLSVSNSAVSGYVLASDGATGMTWVANSGANYYVNAITKSTNTLTFEIAGGLASSSWPTYTFGDAAFKSTGTTSGDVAAGNHVHDMSAITNAGTLATLDAVGTSEITNSSVTINKLSPAVGSNGQFLTITGGNLAWATINTTSVDFLSLPNTPSSFSGTGGQYLKVNSGATAVEFAALAVGKSDITTTNSGSVGKILGVDSNGDLEWTDKSSTGAGSISPTNLNGLTTNGSAGQLIQTDGDGTFSYVAAGGVANDSITFTQLANQFKTVASAVTLSSGSATATLDFTAAAVFQITLPSDATNTTITYSNNTIGMTKVIKVTGSGGTGTPTITGTKLSGTLDQTNATVNYIQVTCLGASEFIYTILIMGL